MEDPEPVEESVEEAELVEKLSPSPPAPEPVQVNLGPYGRSLHSEVQRRQRYPRAARMMRMEGTVEVEMRVYVDGELASEPKVSRSSGHPLLDKEALRMFVLRRLFRVFRTDLSGKRRASKFRFVSHLANSFSVIDVERCHWGSIGLFI